MKLSDHTVQLADISSTIANPNLEQTLRELNDFQNTLVTIYDPICDRFIFVNDFISKLVGFQSTKLLNKSKEFWISLVMESERKKVELFLLESSCPIMPNSQNIVKRLNYQLIAPCDSSICVAHEQRIIQTDKLLIINTITDISEKMKVVGLINKLSTKPNDDLSISNQSSSIDSLDDISHREHEVLQLIGTGLSSKQIANRLFISNHTAISHRKNLIEKFRVKNTAELIKEASKVVWLS